MDTKLLQAMSSYRIQIKNPYQKTDRQSTFLYLLNGFTMTGIGAFTYLLGGANWIQSVFHAAIIPVNILSAGILVYGMFLLFAVFFRNRRWLQHPVISRWIRVFCIIANIKVAIIFLLSSWWLAAALSGLMFLAQLFGIYIQNKTSRPLYAVFEQSRILLPASARKQSLEWTEVERVLVRHGNLTIDCVNNVLYQWPLHQIPQIELSVFEGFCREQIELAKQHRTEDW